MEARNNEVFKITGDVPVSVTLEFNVHESTSEKDILLNAKDYLDYYLTSGNHKSWGRKISVKGVMARIRSQKERGKA